MDDYGLFYRSWKSKIFNYLMRMTGDSGQAGDIMQETFTRHLSRYGEGNRDVPLLYRIAHNVFMDEKRRGGKWQDATELEEQEPPLDEDRRLMIRSEYRRVLAALDLIDPDEREILALVVGEDLTYREIADIVGISEANVKVKVHRARLKLRAMLREGTG
jgi:RNA polymerase sigma-70 factor (ECF subfamily)